MSIKSIILVCSQILTMIYLTLFNNPIASGFGLIFQVLGIGIGIWGIFAMRLGNFNIQPEVKSHSLIHIGPYKWIRNPMYLGLLLVYLPIAITNYNWINILVWIFLLLTLLLKIDSEEYFLEERFNQEYRLYKSKTNRLIPYIY